MRFLRFTKYEKNKYSVLSIKEYIHFWAYKIHFTTLYRQVEPTNPYKKYIWKKQCLAYATWCIADEHYQYSLYEKCYNMVLDIMKISTFGLCEMQSSLVLGRYGFK